MTDKWQPIETAPKDGTRVLLHSPDTHLYTPVLGTWVETKERWEEWGGYYPCNPTHWMPLPEPPKEARTSMTTDKSPVLREAVERFLTVHDNPGQRGHSRLMARAVNGLRDALRSAEETFHD